MIPYASAYGGCLWDVCHVYVKFAVYKKTQSKFEQNEINVVKILQLWINYYTWVPISSPCPIDASACRRFGDKHLGTFFRGILSRPKLFVNKTRVTALWPSPAHFWDHKYYVQLSCQKVHTILLY